MSMTRFVVHEATALQLRVWLAFVCRPALKTCHPDVSFFFFFLIEFIGVKLVNKSIQVLRVQLNKTSSTNYIVCSLPQAKPLSISISPIFAYLPPPMLS